MRDRATARKLMVVILSICHQPLRRGSRMRPAALSLPTLSRIALLIPAVSMKRRATPESS